MMMSMGLRSLRRIEINWTRTNSLSWLVRSKYPMWLFNAIVNPKLKIVQKSVKKLKYYVKYWSLRTLNWNLLTAIQKYCFTSKIKSKYKVNKGNLLFSAWKINLDGLNKISKIAPLKLIITDCQWSENQGWTKSNIFIDRLKIKEAKFRNYRMLA